ncbi:GLL2 protein, partial [Sterrhoptilus dennistouni]|nr:GLL2 protein [Sterrhoptilus dennistouni]
MRILYLLFSLFFVALQVSPGLSSPRREMFFCKGGSCHFGGCPFHLIKVGKCFGFRSCCK